MKLILIYSIIILMIRVSVGTQDLHCDISQESENVCQSNNSSDNPEKLPSICNPSIIQSNTNTSLFRRLFSKLRLYYGDNDQPVTRKTSSITSYLKRFGYIDYVKRLFYKSFKDRVSAHISRRLKRFKYRITFAQLLREDIKSMAEVVKIALKMFQKFMRLKVTGVANTDTLLTMNKPRCGGKDLGEQRVEPAYMTLKDKIVNFISNTIKSLPTPMQESITNSIIFKNLSNYSINYSNLSLHRTKRHVLAGSRWKIFNISYKITKYASKYRNNRKVIDQQIAKAFKYWSEITPLVFYQMPTKTSSKDILIDFRWETGEHGDGDPLDGAGKVLAHSYFPQYGGDVHFDDDEMWTHDSTEGSNILVTAIHEIGHSLGLDHSDVTGSIMNPVYPPFDPKKKLVLHQDDIRGAQILYGSKSGVPEVPNLCLNASVDAMYKEVNSCAIYVFKGKYFWKIKADEMKMDSQYPKLIEEHFPEIKSHINAVIQTDDLNHFVFKDEYCYKYDKNLKLEEGFPVRIKDFFKSLPTSLDVALAIGDTIYAVKGALIWKYIIDDNSGEIYEPEPIESIWPGIPPNIDSAVKIKNTIYFFKDQGFYRLNKFNGKYKKPNVDPPYPRKTSLWWFGCQ